MLKEVAEKGAKWRAHVRNSSFTFTSRCTQQREKSGSHSHFPLKPEHLTPVNPHVLVL